MGLVGEQAPDEDTDAASLLIIHHDAMWVTSHSERHLAAPTLERDYECHPSCAFIDRGQAGAGRRYSAGRAELGLQAKVTYRIV